MANPLKKKLFYQTLAYFLPIVIASIIITSVILSLSTNRFFQKTILADYKNIIQTTAGSISLYYEDARTNLESLAQVLSSLRLDPWQKEIALTAFLQENPQFSAIDLISTQGCMIAQVLPASLFQNEAQKDLIDQAVSGRIAVSKVTANGNELPHVDFFVPVFGLGQVEEILRARLSLKYIWDILEGIRIGETGQVYVMDGSGRVIAHKEIHRVLQPCQGATPEALNAIREKAGPMECDAEHSSYNLGIYISDLDWVVGVTQPRSEVYGYLYQNIYWAALISLIIAVCSVLLAWKGTRRLLAPINALHGEVLNISRGDLDHIVPIDREDEIADLSRAFNEMTGSLKKYLDQEVETACTLAHHKSLAILGTVASEVSHEVRNSLLGVQMMLNGLKREPLSPSGQEVVKIIEKEMEQNSSLVKGFLKIARKPDLKLARGPLDGLIREVLDRIRPEAGSRGIAVTLNWDPAIPHIRMDAALINNAFANLVKNSVEAMNGSGSLAITGKIAQEEILVSVSDTGSGMDSETLERIFEPFFSTKGDQGIGLGLAIVKSNIEAHGWTIECASSPGKGAEFIIRVPLD